MDDCLHSSCAAQAEIACCSIAAALLISILTAKIWRGLTSAAPRLYIAYWRSPGRTNGGCLKPYLEFAAKKSLSFTGRMSPPPENVVFSVSGLEIVWREKRTSRKSMAAAIISKMQFPTMNFATQGHKRHRVQETPLESGFSHNPPEPGWRKVNRSSEQSEVAIEFWLGSQRLFLWWPSATMVVAARQSRRPLDICFMFYQSPQVQTSLQISIILLRSRFRGSQLSEEECFFPRITWYLESAG